MFAVGIFVEIVLGLGLILELNCFVVAAGCANTWGAEPTSTSPR